MACKQERESNLTGKGGIMSYENQEELRRLPDG